MTNPKLGARVFPPASEGAKENQSSGLASFDGAAPPPCKDSAAPTAAIGGFPYEHCNLAEIDSAQAVADAWIALGLRFLRD